MRGIDHLLASDEIAEADEVAKGRLRNVANYRLRDGRPLTDAQRRDAHYLGARTEKAGAVVYRAPWNKFKINEADLAGFVDVKGVGLDRLGLLVPNRRPDGTPAIVPDWAYTLISGEHHPHYWVVGWMWGSDLLLEPTVEPQRGRPCRLVSCRSPKLQAPETLQQIIARLPPEGGPPHVAPPDGVQL